MHLSLIAGHIGTLLFLIITQIGAFAQQQSSPNDSNYLANGRSKRLFLLDADAYRNKPQQSYNQGLLLKFKKII